MLWLYGVPPPSICLRLLQAPRLRLKFLPPPAMCWRFLRTLLPYDSFIWCWFNWGQDKTERDRDPKETGSAYWSSSSELDKQWSKTQRDEGDLRDVEKCNYVLPDGKVHRHGFIEQPGAEAPAAGASDESHDVVVTSTPYPPQASVLHPQPSLPSGPGFLLFLSVAHCLKAPMQTQN